MRKKEVINVGIDLGTTFCSIAVYNNRQEDYEILVDKSNNGAIPSWVSFSSMKDQDVLVGYSAKVDKNVDYVVYDAKRLIGRPFKDVDEKWMDEWKFDIVNTNNIPCIETFVDIKSDKVRFHPEEISAILLKHMMNILSYRRSDFEIGEVVVTVPAKFSNEQRKATETACKLAGIERVTLLNEPSAAVLEYKRKFGRDTLVEGSQILVVDFGGGTLDINCCVMERNNEVRVIQNGGDENLGGNDFDLAMKNLIKKKIENEFGIDDYYTIPKRATPEQKRKYISKEARLRTEAEKAKIALSDKNNYEVDLEYLFEGDTDDEVIQNIIEDGLSIALSEFEKAIKPLLKQFKERVQDCTSKAYFNKDNVDLVVLVGGTSQIPLVQRTLKSMFYEERFSDKHFNVMTAVAKGACYFADNFAGKLVDQKELYDTIPSDIGLEVQDRKFLPIIKAGTPLPTTQFTEVHSDNNQEIADFRVFSGNQIFVESEGMKRECGFKIIGLPKGKKISFRIELTVKENGMLDVRVMSLGLDKQITGELLNHKMDLRIIERDYLRIERHFQEYLPPLL